MRQPSLYAVVIEFGREQGGGAAAVCGFQHERRNWLGRRLLDACQVKVLDRPGSASVVSYGTFSRDDLQMAAVKEAPFPFDRLDLAGLTVEPRDARGRIVEHALAETAGTVVEPQCDHVLLTVRDGQLAWQGTVDFAGIGLHAVILDAASGVVVFHKFDRYHPA
jgi:hypothetical protein